MSVHGLGVQTLINVLFNILHYASIFCIVPTPTVSVTDPDTQMLGESLTLYCNVTTVRGITSTVNIVWSSGGTELDRMSGTMPVMEDDLLVYMDSYTISQLNTTDDGRMIQCRAEINTIMASDSVTLDVNCKLM